MASPSVIRSAALVAVACLLGGAHVAGARRATAGAGATAVAETAQELQPLHTKAAAAAAAVLGQRHGPFQPPVVQLPAVSRHTHKGQQLHMGVNGEVQTKETKAVPTETHWLSQSLRAEDAHEEPMRQVERLIQMQGHWAARFNAEWLEDLVAWQFSFSLGKFNVECKVREYKGPKALDPSSTSLSPFFVNNEFVGFGGTTTSMDALFEDVDKTRNGYMYYLFKAIDGDLVVDVDYVEEGNVMRQVRLFLEHKPEVLDDFKN